MMALFAPRLVRIATPRDARRCSRTSAPLVKRFEEHYVPRNRGVRFRLISDLTVCLGATVYRPKSAARIVTHRTSQVAAKAVVLQQKVRLFLEQLIDKMFIQRGRIPDDLWRPPLE